MKNIYKLFLFIFLCISCVLFADTKGGNQNNQKQEGDPTTAKFNKAQKEHLKIYRIYSLSNSSKISKEESKKLFDAFYGPISTWCAQAEKLYEQSAQAAKDKMEGAKNPQQKQQLNMLAMVYEQAAKSCQMVRKGYEKKDQVSLESNIKKYAALEKQMMQNRIQFPAREWISSQEGDTVLMMQRKYIRQMRQMQPRQPQPQPKR